MAFLILPLLLLCCAGGSFINVKLNLLPKDLLPIERRLFGLATGLVLIAYYVLALGLFGALYPVLILAGFALAGVLGFGEYIPIYNEISKALAKVRLSLVGWLASVFYAIFALTSFIGCFAPPTASFEYDSLCYHLADPKIYLLHHRIIYLPWESHSNFAFTMEMLYTVGLSLHSIALAKLFHWTSAAICVVAVFLIGRRIHSIKLGVVASLLFASLPLVFWEAGTAYVDLGATAFGLLSLLALSAYLIEEKSDPGWLRTATIMMAIMVSIKATSLITASFYATAILAIELLRKRGAKRAIAAAGLFGICAVALGSVWYVKSWIITGNPFFPFGYSLFGGRHWDAANAQTYAASNGVFGVGHRPVDLLLAPWNLILYLMPTISAPDGFPKPFNDNQTFLASLSPLFPASLFVPALWRQKTPPAIKALAAYGGVSLVVWFVLTQQVRYLLPVIPVYCQLVAFVAVELWSTKLIARTALWSLLVVSVLFSSAIAFQLISLEGPVVFGTTSRATYISSGLPSYPAFQFLNNLTPLSDGVAFYGEPTDFYCDHPYMWAEPGHGIVIPYDTMSGPSDLKAWFLSHGFHYIFIDYTEAPIAPGPGMNGLVYALTYGSGAAPIYQHGPISIFEIR